MLPPLAFRPVFLIDGSCELIIPPLRDRMLAGLGDGGIDAMLELLP